MGHNNKKVYLWNDPAFREWFDQALNPGIDPKTIQVCDKRTVLRELNACGQIHTTTPFTLSFRKGFYRYQGRYKTEYEFCCEDPVFMQWFDARLNPEINVATLRVDDNKTKLNYFDNGEIFSITPRRFLGWKQGVLLIHSSTYCGGNAAFMTWFNKNRDLNPGFDPNLTPVTSALKIKYHEGDGGIGTNTVRSCFKKNKSLLAQCWLTC